MNGPVKEIAGQLVAMARHYTPNHAFAALTHDGTDVHFASFEGRMLKDSSKVAADGKLHGLFADLRNANLRKAGFFKKEGYKSVRVVYRARTKECQTALDFDDAAAFAFDRENRRQAFQILVGETYPDPTATMFRDPLPEGLPPTEIARHFMADHKLWNDFAYAESEASDEKLSDSEASWNQGQSYDRLILRYCSPDKAYQALAFGSSDSHHPDHETVLSEKVDGDVAEVMTRYQDPEHDFLKKDFRYRFKRDGAKWLLDEVFFCADDGEYPCL